MKIVISTCYGGFGLSEAAIFRYAELKGITLWFEDSGVFSTYYTVPKDQRVKELPGAFADHSLEDRIAYNEQYSKQELYARDIDRTDPILVQVVEELGKEADGPSASLKVVEIPDDVDWIIDEQDGAEWVAEKHRRWC